MTKKKAFVIDHELLSPLSIGKENIIPALRENKISDGPIEGFSTDGLPFQNGAEIRTALTEYYQNESDAIKKLCGVDRKFELMAATMGLYQSRLQKLLPNLTPERTGVILGLGAEHMPLKDYESEMIGFIEQKQNAVCELIAHLNSNGTEYSHLASPYDIYANYLAKKFNAKAFQHTILTACVSSTQAIAQAYDAISRNEADVVIAGGVDSIINLVALISFGKLGVIAETTEDVMCKPFDTNRKGTTAGEAAGLAIIASEKFVKENNLTPIAQLLGYGNTLDAFKITAPDPSADGMKRAIKSAINKSEVETQQFDYYYAHGTGTRQNDATELKAFKEAFENHANKVPISTTKDRHGHAIAAAGIQEFSLLLEMMKHDFIPSNLNIENPIDKDLHLVKSNLNQRINYALTANFAFGGINTVLAVKNEK
ncbi:MAG: hypothetical protein BM555_00025 [Crocinitomix sp. MedPE-SWsnd]|nr:MAG: hypothetical protein BM555_00025 [Crocinitomix sp. MedPE-SWsnd]